MLTSPSLICSDLIARGMDLPAVHHVINYDVPGSLDTYVHRVGRTARAGNVGDAWTLYLEKEAHYFWKEIGVKIKRTGKTIERTPIDANADFQLRKAYEEGLSRLGGEIAGDGDESMSE